MEPDPGETATPCTSPTLTRVSVHDTRNRLVRQENSTGTPLVTYGYDGEGRRTSEVSSAVTTTYVYTVDGFLQEVLLGSTVCRRSPKPAPSR